MACKLCLLDRDVLNSHFMPQSGYKNIRNFDPAEVVQMGYTRNNDNSTFRATDIQITSRALCRECEDLFNKRGEAHIASHGYRGGKKQTFRLDSSLKKSGLGHFLASNPFTTPDDRMVTRRPVGQVDINKYYYFCVSVVWRATAIDWKPYPTPYRGILPQPIEEKMRQFLVGECYEKPDIFVSVASITDFADSRRMVFPQCSSDGSFFHFVVFGTRFRAYLDRHPPFFTQDHPIFFYRTTFQGSVLGSSDSLND